MKWIDPRFRGYDTKTGIRLAPASVPPVSYTKGNPIPVYGLIPADNSRYPNHVLREIRKTHR